MFARLQNRLPTALSAARWFALVFAALAFFALPLRAVDAESGHPAVSAEKGAEAHAEHHALPTAPPVLYHGIGGHAEVRAADGAIIEPAKNGPLMVTNSMLIAWIVAAGVIIFAQTATRRIRTTREAANEVPSGAQNFWEYLVEYLYNFLSEILGPKLVSKTFWFFATIFIFILFTNWFGLIPGVGTIGFGHYDANGAFQLERPIFRGANADLNMTAAMALTFFAWWIVWAILENRHGKTGVAGIFTGVGSILKHLFTSQGKDTGFMKWFLIVIFGAVGLIEVVSILVRPVSLSFRLFGNSFAGENILEAMQNIVPWLGPILPIPFYFLELLIGLVQALVFTLLTSIYLLLICEHEEEPGEAAKAHH